MKSGMYYKRLVCDLCVIQECTIWSEGHPSEYGSIEKSW